MRVFIYSYGGKCHGIKFFRNHTSLANYIQFIAPREFYPYDNFYYVYAK